VTPDLVSSQSLLELLSSAADGMNGQKLGVVNDAFVDEEVLKEIERKRQRTEPGFVVKDEKMNEVERGNPPILEEETKKEYSEYFIADNIAANKFRGETEPLYAGNQKEEGRNKWTKFCCWIFILALLAGAITVGVLIALGVINLEPLRQIKESRKLDRGKGTNSVELFEVKNDNAPNVLTNDPGFFSEAKKNMSAEYGFISLVDKKDNDPEDATNKPEKHEEMEVKMKANTTKLDEELFETMMNKTLTIEITTVMPTPTSIRATIETSTEDENLEIMDQTTKIPEMEEMEMMLTGTSINISETTTQSTNNSEETTMASIAANKMMLEETDPDNPGMEGAVTIQDITTNIPEGIIKDDNQTDQRDIEPRELKLSES